MNATAGWLARPRATTLSSPQTALALASAGVLLAEVGYDRWISDAWLLLEAALATGALLYAWREQERLRLGSLLAVGLAFHVALVLVHLGLDIRTDKDSSVVFRWQGNGLLRGDYPRSEYPVGAVLLFAFEAWIGGGATRTANALLMAPFQLLTAACVWLTGFRYARWLAAVLLFWPLNAYYWEFKFDAVPAGLLALGLLLAWRARWSWSAVALALGALVKWTPALAALVLVAWLLAAGRARAAVRYAAVFVFTVALVYVPFLAWSPDEVLAAYTRQNTRSITPESLWYLLLRPLGLARVRTHISFGAVAPDWADALAVVIQVLAVAGLVVLAARTRGGVRGAVALAAMAPVSFLLTNRIFSPQFVLVLFAGLAFAGALVVTTRVEQLAVGAGLAGASLGNAFVYPYALPHYAFTWPLCSAVLFGLGLALTAWLSARALRTANGRTRSV